MEQSMRKNKAMRAASVFLVLTLVSTCGFSGVLAKYVSTDNGTDTARVAKYGVVTTVSGKLFGYSYAKQSDVQNSNSNQIQAVTSNTADSVTANNTSTTAGDLLVAPGTENKEGMTFKVKGNPEVSTTLKVEDAKGSDGKTYVNTDVVLKKLSSGSYAIMVKENASKVKITQANLEQYYTYSDGSFTQVTASTIPPSGDVYKISNSQAVDADYRPIKWTVNGDDENHIDNVADVKTAVEGQLKMAGEESSLEAHKPNQEYPGTESGGGLATVTWKWDIGSTDEVNAKDTLLGSMISTASNASSDGGPGASGDYKIAVVKADSKSATEVKYAKINADSDSANFAVVAYDGGTESTVPEKWDDSNVLACLTVTYGESITVEQVD